MAKTCLTSAEESCQGKRNAEGPRPVAARASVRERIAAIAIRRIVGVTLPRLSVRRRGQLPSLCTSGPAGVYFPRRKEQPCGPRTTGRGLLCRAGRLRSLPAAGVGLRRRGGLSEGVRWALATWPRPRLTADVEKRASGSRGGVGVPVGGRKGTRRYPEGPWPAASPCAKKGRSRPGAGGSYLQADAGQKGGGREGSASKVMQLYCSLCFSAQGSESLICALDPQLYNAVALLGVPVPGEVCQDTPACCSASSAVEYSIFIPLRARVPANFLPAPANVTPM